MVYEEGECTHKSIFPITEKEFAGTLLLPIILALSNAAGIGGGGIIINVN